MRNAKGSTAARTVIAGVAAVAATVAAPGQAPFSTVESRRYMLIGTGPENIFQGRPGVGAAVSISGYEVGANKAPVPSTSDFLTNGSSGGPSLLFNVPSIPLAAQLVPTGICGNGNIAITNPIGVFTLSETGVYGDLGIRTAQPAQAADIGVGNSFYNDSNSFPNTFTSTGLTDPGVNNDTGGFGTFIPAAAANPAAAIEQPTAAGVTGNVNFTALDAELTTARSVIAGLAATQTLNVPGGVLNVDTMIQLAAGLNVIDVVTGPDDFSLNTMTFLIDGPAGSSAIFRIPSAVKMTVANANILIGNGGITSGSVLFFSQRPDNATHFEFSGSILHGVAFWSLGAVGGQISVSEAQGSAQFVADSVSISGSRLCNAAFDPPGSSTPCPGDLNGDRQVSLADLAILLANFGTSGGASAGDGDLDGDGNVGLSDLALILSRFGTTCN